MDSRRKSVDQAFRMFEVHGDGEYLGEAVSKTQHSLQCAQLAEKERRKPEVILGALFHDIGHLVGLDKGLDRMVTGGVDLGAKDHETVGEEFLKELGFPSPITDFVKGHVQAKRYLVSKNKEYYNSLSEASKLTLLHQGGPMTENEAKTFEKHPLFEDLLKMRTWDDLAKDPGCETDSLKKYREMAYNYCTNYGSNFM